MAIFATIQCDVCRSQTTYNLVAKSLIVRWAREAGWTVGSTIKCDKCKKETGEKDEQKRI